MHPRSLWSSTDICWQCRWRLLNQRPNTRRIQARNAVSSSKVLRPPQRALHTSTKRHQLEASSTSTTPSFNPSLIPRPPQLPLRDHLLEWQEQYGGPTEETLSAFENHPKHPAHDEIRNGISKLNSSFKADEKVDMEQREATEDHEDDELITIGLFLKPGDVVELSQPDREPVLAVFVQQLDSNSQFFSVNGRWCHSTIAHIAFAITGCINPALLQPLVPYLPTNPRKAQPKGEVHVPINLAAPVQSILERMTEDAEKIYRANAPVLDTAYAVLADQKRARMMTLSQIAKTLLAQNDSTWKASPAALLAVRKSLNHNEFRFRSDMRSHRLTNVFAIRPKNDVQVVETVHEWIREHREYLASSANVAKDAIRKLSAGASNIEDFLEKARRLIAISRKTREPNVGLVGPSKLKSTRSSEGVQFAWGEPFTNTDKQIINFLLAWVLTGQFIGMDGLVSACTSLISATGCYPKGTIQNLGTSDIMGNEIRRTTGQLFLQEIGVITPFENRVLYDEQLMLPTVRLSRNLELLNTKAELTRRNPDFRDSMADLRRDWGTTAVYCIDDAGAQEIDDGISIERVHEDSTEFWAHVHVANPTAFFDKTHALSGLAAHMTETVYTPERTFPMLPPWATQGHFSLAQNRPVLTFSSRISATGAVLETKIQPGIVRNIVNLTPSHLSSILGDETTLKTQTFVVGGEIPVAEQSLGKPTLSAANLQDLRDLYTTAQRLWDARRNAGGVRIGGISNQVRVFESPGQSGITWHPPSTNRSRHVQGDPIIELTYGIRTSLIHFGMSPANIVEEMMLMACSTAASWCTERNIPVMYRGTIEPPSSETMSSEVLKTRFVLPHIEKYGEVPRGLAWRYLVSLGRAIAHSAPLPHKIIGVPGYVKVTSPLRRFSDMIAHWQIQAAIRHEARTGKKFIAAENTTGSRNILPFTQRQMQESIVTLSPRERIIAGTKRTSSGFWSALALMRAFHYKEAPLPETFRFWVRDIQDESRSFNRGARGLLPDYGFQANFTDTRPVQIGDEWEVQLDRIDMFSRSIYVNPVRLLHREEELV
ncbi:RNB-domain-containing protein [Ophiobolus disseminans]|uniref:RNB-domain-containing protein n=1 Tax=Ophiobolus disseminans TaxID=1469910 RepID=A0A6A6ZQD0_9PLEO|nr:RNB-domain-containing protein [Ophiobolus disseminans]